MEFTIHNTHAFMLMLMLYIYVLLKKAQTQVHMTWLEIGLFSTIIAIIRACACWALFVVTLTNTVHLIYIYIIAEKSPNSSHMYDHGFMDNTNRQAVCKSQKKIINTTLLDVAILAIIMPKRDFHAYETRIYWHLEILHSIVIWHI